MFLLLFLFLLLVPPLHSAVQPWLALRVVDTVVVDATYPGSFFLSLFLLSDLLSLSLSVREIR